MVEKPAFRLVGMKGMFPPGRIMEIPLLWDRFVPRMESIPGRRAGLTYGACRPSAPGTPEEALVYVAAVETDPGAAAPEGMIALDIPAGSYAGWTHEGHISEIVETWDRIWNTWMKETGLTHRPGYDFEVYDGRWNPETGEGPVDILVAVEK